MKFNTLAACTKNNKYFKNLFKNFTFVQLSNVRVYIKQQSQSSNQKRAMKKILVAEYHKTPTGAFAADIPNMPGANAYASDMETLTEKLKNAVLLLTSYQNSIDSNISILTQDTVDFNWKEVETPSFYMEYAKKLIDKKAPKIATKLNQPLKSTWVKGQMPMVANA